MEKLKPVTFISGKCTYYNQNNAQQIMLLKALKVTQDPKKLREMIGVKTVADVYRTLDKMSLRKEYHKALMTAGISFDYLVEKTKKEIDSDLTKPADKLNAIKMLLKSLGMEKYEQEGISGGSWEDILMKSAEKDDQKKIAESGTKAIKEVYQVKQPTMPDTLRISKEKERKVGKSLYE